MASARGASESSKRLSKLFFAYFDRRENFCAWFTNTSHPGLLLGADVVTVEVSRARTEAARGAQPRASTERVSTRRSESLTTLP